MLKQHTPMIHFQYRQKGATLRATELKPKLDKFLIEHVFEKNKSKYSKYLIDEEKDALNYKVKILPKAPVSVEEIDSQHNREYSMYFGNRGGDIKKLTFCDTLEILFFSFDRALLTTIKENINSFFAITNFGTRQNKGFGSFYPKNAENDFLNELKKIKSKFLYIVYKKPDYREQLSDISIIYQLMKSGINFPNRCNSQPSYHKSFLFKYMLNKGIGNEKRFIKENFFEEHVRVKPDNLPKKYVRGLLGIVGEIEFKDPKRRGKIKYKSKIDRFKSPITFKIVENIVAIIPENIPEELYGLKFKFSHGSFKKSIKTPLKSEFDLEEFLSEFADYFNNENVKFRRAKNKKILKEGY
jgi:hypothetical protein